MSAPAAMEVKFSGWDKLVEKFTNADATVRAAIEAGLFIELSNVMTASKRLVPVDFGTLRGSGFVSRPTTVGSVRMITIGYGGPAEAYALLQHEGFYQHPDGGQRKFLEQPLSLAAPSIVQNAGRFAARFLKAGATPPALPPAEHPTTPWVGGG